MKPTTTNTVACFLQELTDRYSVRLPIHEENNMEGEKKPKKMYRLSEQKIYTRYHYVWASSRNKAYELFDEYEPVIEDTEFEPEYKEYDVEEVEDPDLIEENYEGFILNPEDKDG